MEPTTRTVAELAPDVGPDAVSTAVVRAVADFRGIETVDLDACLYNIVETDALEQLFRYGDDGDSGVTGAVRFSMADCDVRVHSDGRITVAPSESETLASSTSTTNGALNPNTRLTRSD